MSTFANIVVGLLLAGTFAAGFALFWIARQDDSRAGRILGLLAMAGTVALTGYLHFGRHWF
ncbi:MAG TPA: hypothetical protein VMU08_16820 [Rhizomicrobium sp.]|nr:hypothetical protein [Rhizomicrobium sp.]